MEQGLPARAKELREAAARVATEAGARDEVRRIAHKLRGVAATHGYPALGAQATDLEGAARDGAEASVLAARARALADAIDAAARAGAAGAIDSAVPARPAAVDRRSAGASGPKRLLGLTIAALDDDDATRRLLALTLGPVGGASAQVLDTPEKLYEAVRAARVDLVIVDAMMPEASGLDVIAALEREHGANGPRYAVLSAATATELGWTLDPRLDIRWFQKPFRPSELVDTIATLLGR